MVLSRKQYCFGKIAFQAKKILLWRATSFLHESLRKHQKTRYHPNNILLSRRSLGDRFDNTTKTSMYVEPKSIILFWRVLSKRSPTPACGALTPMRASLFFGGIFLLRYAGHNSYGKLEEVGIRASLPFAGCWLSLRIFADSVSFHSFTSW